MDIRVRFALGAAGLAAYAVLSHRLMSTAPESLLSIALVLGPMAAASLAGVWGLGRRVLCVGLAGVLAWGAWSWSRSEHLSTAWIYLAQHAGIHLSLALWFGGSLRAGHTPLISLFARRVHALSPGMVVYTRQLTVAWMLYFIAITALSLGLFAFGPFKWWSLLANVLTPLSLVLMFGIEHWLRYRLHPEFERVGMMAAVRAYMQPASSADHPA